MVLPSERRSVTEESPESACQENLIDLTAGKPFSPQENFNSRPDGRLGQLKLADILLGHAHRDSLHFSRGRKRSFFSPTRVERSLPLLSVSLQNISRLKQIKALPSQILT